LTLMRAINLLELAILFDVVRPLRDQACSINSPIFTVVAAYQS